LLLSAAVANHAHELGQLIDQDPLGGRERHRLFSMPAGLAHTAEKDMELRGDVLSRGRAEPMGALLASPVLSLHGGSGARLLRKGVVAEELNFSEGRQFAN